MKSAFSRRMASEFFHRSTLIENRGRREGRVSADTHGPRATKSTRQNHRFSRNNRPSPRNGFNGFLRALPGETGLCCHRRFASSRKTQHLHRGAGTTRLRRPRYHQSSAAISRPSHPASNVRDDREAPLLSEAGRADHRSDLPDMATPVGMRHVGTTGSLRMTCMRCLRSLCRAVWICRVSTALCAILADCDGSS